MGTVDIGKRINELRKKRGLSLRGLSLKCSTTTHTTIDRIEKGEVKPLMSTLEDIAKAADISRSEAGRCFHTYMGCSPIDALIQYRLQMARQMLHDRTQTLQQISYACGFNSVNYFSRRFRMQYGYAPSQIGELGK